MPIYRNPISRDGRPLLTGVAFGVPRTQPELIKIDYTALLDTGTYHTLVGQGIIDDLGLKNTKPDNVIERFGGATGYTKVKVYNNITIILPENHRIPITIHCAGIYYTKGKNPQPFHMAIGMDILKRGKFTMNKNEYILDFP